MKLSTKRFLAYVIDMLIILGFILIINLFMNNKSEEQLKFVNENYVDNKIDFKTYKDKYISLNHDIDKENIVINVISTILIVIVFIIIPNKLNGQTIGSKILKIKVSSNKIKDLLIRSIIVNGLGYMVFMLLVLYISSDSIYFVLTNFLGFCQILVVIINGFMVLYKKGHIGLADILSNTRIEEIK